MMGWCLSPAAQPWAWTRWPSGARAGWARRPVTITSAAVSAVSSFQPRTPSGQVAPGPPLYQIMITLPAADVAAATAVVTTAYDSHGGVDFSVAGRSWGVPKVFKPFRSQHLSIALPSKNQALQLYRLLVPSG